MVFFLCFGCPDSFKMAFKTIKNRTENRCFCSWIVFGPQAASAWPKMVPRWPNMAPRWPKLPPRWRQGGPRWPQDGPKMAQDGPKLAPDSPKMKHAALPNRTSQTHAPWEVLLGPAGEAKGPPNWTQYGPKMAQDGPKMAQDGGSKTPFEKKT